MDQQRWNRVKEIFSDAAERPPEEWPSFLSEACSGDAELRAEVERLLAQGTTDEEIFPRLTHHTLRPGQLLGARFRIRRFVGKGGMGEVYEAADEELGGAVALKILKPEVMSDPQFLERFRREVQFARQVTHPNICRVFDVGRDSSGAERVFLTMEFLDGETLSEFLRRTGPLSVQSALPMVVQMAEALGALHEKGIVHRDFKPGNVLVVQSSNGQPRVVVTDFGLARAVAGSGATATGLTRSTHVLGTPDYMAPEQLVGAPVTPATDLYALGLVMYELVTGKKAFASGKGMENLLQRVVEQPLPPRAHSSEISPQWNSIILRCLARDPEQRPASAAEVIGMVSGKIPSSAPRGALRIRSLLAPLAICLGILAVLILAFRLKDRVHFRGTTPEQHLAILPLNVLNDEAELRVFALGLMETITSRLSQFESGQKPLLVVPASEVRSQEVKTASEAKRKFRVTAAVEGTLQSQGDRVRLLLTLIDTATMRQLETVALEDQRSNALRVQDGAVVRLANALNVQLQPKYAREQQEMVPMAPGAYEFYLQARGYLQRSDQMQSLESAITLLKRALEIDPKFALAHSGLGEAYVYKYQLTRDPELMQQALSSGNQGLSLNPNLPQTAISMGRIQLRTGRYLEAQRSFEQAIALDSRSNEAYQGLADTYSSLKNVQRAESTYLKAIALRPGDWSGYKHLGLFYYEKREFDKAIAQLTKVVELSPDNAQGYVNLGSAQALNGDSDAAEKTFLRALELDPNRISTVTNLAKIYSDRRQYGRAIEYYQRALDLNNRSYLRWGNLGVAYKRAGDMDKSRDALNRALELIEKEIRVNPKRPDLYSFQGYYRALLGRPDFRPPLQKTLELGPEDQDSVARAAEAYAAGGDSRRAVELTKGLLQRGYSVKTLQRSHELRDLVGAASTATTN